MGQLKTDKKSNEITAIPKLLRLLDIKGCLITIDAMGCQTKIAEQIVQQEGDYLLAVKGNQETLYHAVKKALSAQVSAVSHAENITIEQGHGRIEAREYHVLSAQALSQPFPEWKNLKSIGVAIGYRINNKGKESLDYRYYISSAELNTDKFATAVRSHWGSKHDYIGFLMSLWEKMLALSIGENRLKYWDVCVISVSICCGQKQPKKRVFAENNGLRAWILTIWTRY